MIEWKNILINPFSVEFVKYQTFYPSLFALREEDGEPSAYIFLKSKQDPYIVACTKEEYAALKGVLLGESHE